MDGAKIGKISTDIGTLYILKFANYKFEDFLHPFTSSGFKKNTNNNRRTVIQF